MLEESEATSTSNKVSILKCSGISNSFQLQDLAREAGLIIAKEWVSHGGRGVSRGNWEVKFYIAVTLKALWSYS